MLKTPQTKSVSLKSFSAADKIAVVQLGVYNPNIYPLSVHELEGHHKADFNVQKSIPAEVLQNLPRHLHNYQVALWDETHGNIILVMEGTYSGKKPRTAIYINTRESRRDDSINHTASLGVVTQESIEAEIWRLL